MKNNYGRRKKRVKKTTWLKIKTNTATRGFHNPISNSELWISTSFLSPLQQNIIPSHASRHHRSYYTWIVATILVGPCKICSRAEPNAADLFRRKPSVPPPYTAHAPPTTSNERNQWNQQATKNEISLVQARHKEGSRVPPICVRLWK